MNPQNRTKNHSLILFVSFQMTNLRNKQTENQRRLNGQLNELKEIGARKSNLISGLCVKHDDLEDEIRRGSEKIVDLGQKLNRLQTEKSESGDILKSLGVDRDAVAGENVRRSRELDGLKAELAGQGSELETLETGLSELNRRCVELESQIETLLTSTQSKVSDLREEVGLKSDDLDIVSKEEATLNGRFVLFVTQMLLIWWLHWSQM